MLLVGSRLIEASYVNRKPWKNKVWRWLWIPLWKLYSLLVSDPHKGESLGTCDELPWGVVLTSRFDFMRVGDPIQKECKISCWWMMNIANVVLKYVWKYVW